MFGGVLAEVAFGIENAGAPPAEIEPRARAALDSRRRRAPRRPPGRGALGRRAAARLPRVDACARARAAAPRRADVAARRRRGARAARLVRRLARERGTAVVISEQRVARTAPYCDRVDLPRRRRRRSEAPGAWNVGRGPARRGGDVLCRLDGIDFAYAAGEPVLSRAALELRRGEIVALVGPTAAGRRRSAKIAAGLLEPDGGTRTRAAGLRTSRRIRAGTSRASAATTKSPSARVDSAAAARAIAAVGLEGYEARHPRDLSSGERERLALAAVLATEPDVLVLDEPRAASTRRPGRGSPPCCGREAPKRATLLVTHDLDLVGGRRRPHRRARGEARACRCLERRRSPWPARPWRPPRGRRSPPTMRRFSLLLVALALTATAYAWLESGPGSAAELALIGALAGIAAAGRVLFAAVPGVQPVTVIAVAAGAALGARAGMAVGATAALVSNLFLGQGPWTPWQMLGWAGCGLAGALARRAIQGRLPFALSAPSSASRSARSWTSGCGSASTRTPGRRSRPCSRAACRSTSRTRSATSSSPSSRGPELRRLLERYGRRLRPQVVWD